MSSDNKRSKRGADYDLDQNNADQYHREMDHGSTTDGGGSGGYGIPLASDAVLRNRRIVRARAPPGGSGGAAAAAAAAAESSSTSPARSNPFAAVSLIAANSSSGSGVGTAAAPPIRFVGAAAAASNSFLPPAAAAAANPFGGLFQLASTTAAARSNTNTITPKSATAVTPHSDCTTLDRKLRTRMLGPQGGRATTTTTTQRNGVTPAPTSNVRELFVAYVLESESIASAIDQAPKKVESESAAPAPASKPVPFSFSAPAAAVVGGTGGGTGLFGFGGAATGGKENDNGGDDDDADAPEDGDDANDPSFSGTPAVDEGYDALREYENVAVYRIQPDGKFKRLTQSKLVLQQSQSQPTLSRMIVRQPRGGLTVLLNMVVQGSYTYKERVDPKRKITFGQIGFLGCNSQPEGFKTYALKAPADIAQPLHKQLVELAAAYDAAKQKS